MNPLQYAGKLVVKTLQCKDEFEEWVLNKIFFEGAESIILQSMHEFGDCKKEVKVIYLAFQVTLLLRPQRKETSSNRPSSTSTEQAVSKNLAPWEKSSWASSRAGLHIADLRAAFGSSAVPRDSSGTPILASDLCTASIVAKFSPIASTDQVSTIESAPCCKVCKEEGHSTSQFTFIPNDQQERVNKFREKTTSDM